MNTSQGRNNHEYQGSQGFRFPRINEELLVPRAQLVAKGTDLSTTIHIQDGSLEAFVVNFLCCIFQSNSMRWEVLWSVKHPREHECALSGQVRHQCKDGFGGLSDGRNVDL